MANSVVLKTTFLLRRGLSTEWSSVNPVLKTGEPGFEIDTGKLKIGRDGLAWNDLEYYGDNAHVKADGKTIVIDEAGALAIAGFANATPGQSMRKAADGSIEWFNAATSTDLQALDTEVTTLQNTVVSLVDVIHGNESNPGLANLVQGHSNEIRDLQAITEIQSGEIANLQSIINNDIYTKTETDEKINSLIGEKISGVYRYKGTVNSYADLPVSGNEVGDVWNVETANIIFGIKAGDNVAWNGSNWDVLAGIQDLSALENKIDAVPSVLMQGLTVTHNTNKALLSLMLNEKQLDGSYVPKTEVVELPEATEKQAGLLGAIDKLTINSLPHVYLKRRFNFPSLPPRTRIDYTESEIRILCPPDTKWSEQAVGAGGNPNIFYTPFYTYAPAEAAGYKDLTETQVQGWNTGFSGIDKYGRKYSIIWIRLAEKDANGNWTYLSTNKYDHFIEWFDANGNVIESDTIRINICADEAEYNTSIPYYAKNLVTNTSIASETALGLVKSATGANKVTVEEDGTMSVKSVSTGSLIDDPSLELILDGGDALG